MSTPEGSELRGDTRRDAPDAHSVRRLRLGDKTALAELMDRYWSGLVGYAARLTGSPDSAEDVAQEVFVSLWRQRSSWDPDSVMGPLIYRMARNLALKEERRRRVRLKWSWRARDQRTVATPLDHAAEYELRDAFEEALATLPPRRREAFALARYHGMATSEIAEIMGVSYQTAANHLSMAAADLRLALADYLE